MVWSHRLQAHQRRLKTEPIIGAFVSQCRRVSGALLRRVREPMPPRIRVAAKTAGKLARPCSAVDAVCAARRSSCAGSERGAARVQPVDPRSSRSQTGAQTARAGSRAPPCRLSERQRSCRGHRAGESCHAPPSARKHARPSLWQPSCVPVRTSAAERRVSLASLAAVALTARPQHRSTA